MPPHTPDHSRTPSTPNTGFRSYAAVHGSIREERGPASTHPCFDCGGVARDWSYQYNGSPEIVDPRGRRYADDVWGCYVPRCGRCHAAFDAPRNPEAQEARRNRARVLGEKNKERFGSDPEFAAARRELGRKVGLLRTDKKTAAARKNLKIARASIPPETKKETGRKLGKLRSERLKNDPVYAEEQREQSRRNASIRRRCSECGLESHPPGIARHHRSSGHTGYTEI